MGNCCKKRKNNTNKNIEILEEQKPTKKIILDDFEDIKLIGKGSYGKVVLVRLKSNGKLYAMKILNKVLLKLTKQEAHTKNERNLMTKINNPFIVNIKFAFQDKSKLYLVTEFIQGGELFFHLKRKKTFSEEATKFYAIELILAISYLHKNNTIYRDLKPENILINADGHIKITDFGLSKLFYEKDKAYTICGTPQYIAPEIFLNTGYDKNVDWWSLGVVLYEMLEGRIPFKINSPIINYNIYKKEIIIYKNKTDEMENFIKSLLVLDPKKRLGFNGSEEVKNHPLFKDVDWQKAENKELIPPFIPNLKDELDLKYFDEKFTEEEIDINKIQNTPKNIKTKVYDNEYKDFSFIDESFDSHLLNESES